MTDGESNRRRKMERYETGEGYVFLKVQLGKGDLLRWVSIIEVLMLVQDGHRLNLSV